MEASGVGLLREDEVAEEMGKRARVGVAWGIGNKRLCVKDASSNVVAAAAGSDDPAKRAKLLALLTAQLGVTQGAADGDPRRVLKRNPAQACREMAAATERLRGTPEAPDDATQSQLIYEEETWKLTRALLSCGREMKRGVLEWVQCISRRRILEVMQACKDLSEEDCFLTVLGWLVAANLNVDAARLAMAEGEYDLANVILCQDDRKTVTQLLTSYRNSDPHRNQYLLHPLLLQILDLMAGVNERLLNELGVDWRIRLASTIVRKSDTDASLEQCLMEFCETAHGGAAVNDTQFQILIMFSKLSNDEAVIGSDHIQRVLQLEAGEDRRDACLKWQLLVVFVSGEIIKKDILSSDTALQLFQTMCDECEALGIPEWSAFITLHQNLSLASTESQIRRTLCMHSSNWIGNDGKEAFLSDELQLPSNWLLQIKAYWYNHLHQVEKEFECLTSMGNYDQAHATFFRKIIPSMAVTEDTFVLESLLNHLSQSQLLSHQHCIPHWELGGGLLFLIQELLSRVISESDRALRHFQRDMTTIALKVEEAGQLWHRTADTHEERMKIRKLYEVLSHRMEARYSQQYSAVHGKSNIMSRVLLDKCKKQKRALQFFSDGNSSLSTL